MRIILRGLTSTVSKQSPYGGVPDAAHRCRRYKTHNGMVFGLKGPNAALGSGTTGPFATTNGQGNPFSLGGKNGGIGRLRNA